MVHSLHLHLIYFLYSIVQLNVNKWRIKCTNDWIQTAVLWCQGATVLSTVSQPLPRVRVITVDNGSWSRQAFIHTLG